MLDKTNLQGQKSEQWLLGTEGREEKKMYELKKKV